MDAVEEVKARLNIEDVVSEYVQLKRAGRNFKGLSPFTSERTASFMVSPEKGIWHDFSSGKGGNMFSFVMEMEGLDFREALEHLARKAGLDLSQFQSSRGSGQSKVKERLYQALELASKFYQVQFSKSQLAIDYITQKRKFQKDTVLAYRLGYSPNTGDALLRFLRSRGFTDQEIQQAGLSAKRYRGGEQDMFRGRLMVPLMDAQGRVIGFTARLLHEDPNAPKYINTPQTLLYDKGRHVFGLHLAKEAIRKAHFAVLVEGNLDVIASHQAGVAQVVATAGTALTESQLKTLARFAPEVRLAFDQDAAGIAAAERALPIAARAKVTLGIITIPEGKDPDELVRKDPKLWVRAIEQHQYAPDWLVQKYQQSLDLTTAVGKKEFTDVLLRVVRKLEDEVEQDHYLDKLAEIIGASKQALHNKLHGIEAADTPVLRRPKLTPVDAKQFDQTKLHNHYLTLMLMRPKLREHMQHVTPEMLNNPLAKQLFGYLQDNLQFRGTKEELDELTKLGAEPDALNGLQDYVKMLVLEHETLYQDDDDVELGYEAQRLQLRLIEQYVKTKKTELVHEMQQASGSVPNALLQQAKELDELLKITKSRA